VESLLELAGGGPESCEAAQGLARHRIEELEARVSHITAALVDAEWIRCCLACSKGALQASSRSGPHPRLVV
jgi:hypothetical protein